MRSSLKDSIRPLFVEDDPVPIGTATQMSSPDQPYDGSGFQQEMIMLVTCGHVIQRAHGSVLVGLTPNHKIRTKKDEWESDPLYDVAIYNPGQLVVVDEAGHPTDPANVAPHLIGAESISVDIFEPMWDNLLAKTDVIKEGTDLLLAGYPSGWKVGPRYAPVFRRGMIADTSNWDQDDLSSILIDGSGYEGQSGGPVFISSGPHSSSDGNMYFLKGNPLLGIMTDYTSDTVPYSIPQGSEADFSNDIQIPRNTGLVEALPIKCLQEAVMRHIHER